MALHWQTLSVEKHYQLDVLPFFVKRTLVGVLELCEVTPHWQTLSVEKHCQLDVLPFFLKRTSVGVLEF